MQTEEFQFKALSVMMDTPVMQGGEWPLPEYFDSPDASTMCRLIRETAKRLKLPITFSILKDTITRHARGDRAEAKRLARLWRRMQSPMAEVERRYAEQELKDVSQKRAIGQALLRSIELYKQDRVAEIKDIISEALAVGQTITHLGLNPFKDAEGILNREMDTFRPIRTLIAALDTHLPHGGLCVKDLGVVLATSGVGKTMFLVHAAKAAVVQRVKTVYFTVEMSEADIAERFIASFSGVKLTEMYERKHITIRRMKRHGLLYGDDLIVKHFPSQTASVQTLDAHLRLLSAQLDFHPGMIIVDYAGEMAGVTVSRRQGSSERYYELGSIFSDLTSLAQQRHVSLWTGAQSSKIKGVRELITIEDIAESFRGVFTASTVVSLNQTQLEYENQQMRLFLAKNRKGIAKKIIPVSTGFAKGMFYRKVVPDDGFFEEEEE